MQSMLAARNRISMKSYRSILVIVLGIGLLLAGLAWDIALHSSGEALSSEDLFAVDNPGHLVLGIGLALIIAGTALALFDAQPRLRAFSVPSLAAVALITFASGCAQLRSRRRWWGTQSRRREREPAYRGGDPAAAARQRPVRGGHRPGRDEPSRPHREHRPGALRRRSRDAREGDRHLDGRRGAVPVNRHRDRRRLRPDHAGPAADRRPLPQPGLLGRWRLRPRAPRDADLPLREWRMATLRPVLPQRRPRCRERGTAAGLHRLLRRLALARGLVLHPQRRAQERRLRLQATASSSTPPAPATWCTSGPSRTHQASSVTRTPASPARSAYQAPKDVLIGLLGMRGQRSQ